MRQYMWSVYYSFIYSTFLAPIRDVIIVYNEADYTSPHRCQLSPIWCKSGNKAIWLRLEIKYRFQKTDGDTSKRGKMARLLLSAM